MEAKSDMVSFRAGVLNDRLRAGPLTAGAKTKRDLWRYYALLDAAMGEWSSVLEVTDEEMEAIKAFIDTRYWESIPETDDFWRQFLSFARSPLATRFGKECLLDAANALKSADRTALLALIDRAEVGASSPQQGAATAGATSAAS